MSDYGSVFENEQPAAKDDLPKSIFKDDPWAPAASTLEQPAVGAVAVPQAGNPLLVTAPATPVATAAAAADALPVALLAGAGVALLGGLLWAGVVVATDWDIGILAWLIGAATGVAVARLAGGALVPAARVAAGLLAAGGIVVGKYVIFVHAVRQQFGALLAAEGRPAGYLDTRQMGIFIHHLGTLVKPIYILWIALAFFAAVRTSGGGAILRRRR